MRIMAKEVADRIMRYGFAAKARYALPIVAVTPGPYIVDGRIGGLESNRGWLALTEEEQKRARAAQTTTMGRVQLVGGGGDPPEGTGSPVLLIGHSYTNHFREQLVRELNMLIRMNVSAGGTTEPFSDFLRSPVSLKNVRIIVWVTTEQHMTHFKTMPEPIMAALE
jgi:hypothetical protein